MLTRGEGSVDVSLEKLTMTKTLAPHAGLQLDVGASGSVTVDGLRAEAHKVAAVVIGVGRAAGSPVKATVEIKNSVFANSANGVSTAQSALSDVSWKFSDNVYRSNGTGLEISANAAARASYEMVANRYEAQTTVGMTGSFKPLEGISVSFSSTGEFYDSNLRHAEFDIAGAGIVDIRVLDLKGTVSRGAQNESGLRYGITADVRAGMNAHVDIRRTSITGSLGAGLRAEAELPRLGTAFIEANASHFDGNRDGAVVVGWSFKFSEEPNTFSDNSGFGIVAEDSAVSITTDEITGNGNGIIVRRGGPVEVAGNTISGNSGDGLVLESIRDARVEANTITRNGGVGIVLKPDTTATLASNTFGANSGGDVVGGAPTAATAQPAESRIEIEIHSAVLRPSGDLEVVYSIDRAERIDYPLQVVFLRANVDDPSRPVEVHSETLEWADPPPGEFRAAFPNPEGRRIVAGDLLVIETRSNRGDRTRPRTVTSSDLSAQPGPSSLAADVGAMSSPTEHPTVDDQDGELPRQGRSAGERPAGGACSAPAPGTVNLEYVMLAILSGGLVGSRTRQR